MFIPLLLGLVAVIISMVIQIVAIVFTLKYLFTIVASVGGKFGSRGGVAYVISVIMVTLFIGHLVQMTIWAGLFMSVGEFSDFLTAFYHSMVNFASLGYGDIVMSERWRLLGAIEASVGVLMFGVSAGAMLSIMSYLLKHDVVLQKQFDEIEKQSGVRGG